MKILLVAINYDPEPTGIGPYVGSLARNLLSRGHHIEVITGIPHYPQWAATRELRGLRETEIVDGVTVHRVRHVIPSGGIGIARALMELTFGASAVAFPWGQPDLVLTVSPPLIGSLIVLGRSRLTPGGPTVAVWTQDLYTRGLTELGDKRSWKLGLARALEGFVLRSADAVVMIDERFRRFALEELGVAPEKVSVHRNWVHLDTAVPAEDPARVRARMGWGDRPVALHAGSMGEKQGLEYIVQAGRIAQERGSDLLFVLMGHGSRRAEMERLAKGCPNVSVIDPVDQADVTSTMQAADVLLVCERPGVREMALPSKLTSYFTAGRPVVASTHPEGTSAALIREADAGRLVAPGDAEGIYTTTAELISDPEIAQIHGASARLYAHEHMVEAAAVSAFDADLGRVREVASVRRSVRKGALAGANSLVVTATLIASLASAASIRR